MSERRGGVIQVLIGKETRAGKDRYQEGAEDGYRAGWLAQKAGDPKNENLARTGDDYREGYADEYPKGYDAAALDSAKKKKEK